MTVNLVCGQNAKTGELKYTGVTEDKDYVRTYMYVTKCVCACVLLCVLCIFWSYTNPLMAS